MAGQRGGPDAPWALRRWLVAASEVLDRPVMAPCGRASTARARQVWPQVTTPLARVGGLGHQLRALRDLRDAGERPNRGVA